MTYQVLITCAHCGGSFLSPKSSNQNTQTSFPHTGDPKCRKRTMVFIQKGKIVKTQKMG
tara:strand:- start:399 stop:575 length:177 start_codon:yes stop_codon:yes gene_type:complete